MPHAAILDQWATIPVWIGRSAMRDGVAIKWKGRATKRNLKALGLAMVAACVFGAVAVSAAQGETHHLTVPTAPAIVTATDQVERFEFVTPAVYIRCEDTRFEGTLAEKTSSEITVTPTMSNCKLNNTVPVTTDVNHCAFKLATKTNENGDAEVRQECGEFDSIKFTFELSGEACTIDIGPQIMSGGVHYTQTENPTTEKQDVTIRWTTKEITYLRTGGSVCQEVGKGHDGQFLGGSTAQAFTEVDSPNCVELTGTTKTTPKTHFEDCETYVQNLELTTT